MVNLKYSLYILKNISNFDYDENNHLSLDLINIKRLLNIICNFKINLNRLKPHEFY